MLNSLLKWYCTVSRCTASSSVEGLVANSHAEHLDSVPRSIVCASGHAAEPLDDTHTRANTAEDRVLPIEVWGWRERDEKLTLLPTRKEGRAGG
jgi:hypothetical protein